MKSSLGKLRRIAMNKSAPRENLDHHRVSMHTDGLNQAAKDMQDMRACYDSLLSAAAATANSAYEFSESLLELGNCVMEKNPMHDDGESGGALSLLGGVQLELRKLVDSYRSHIITTITNPSESLLSELRKVEEMKLQCEEKREMFEYMTGQHNEKGKGETFNSHQIQTVCEEYDEAARLCVFRVESLKQGQCRSLLTQAARHHVAQSNFFRKGLQSLEAVEPQIRKVVQKQHIEYELDELNDMEDGDDEADNNGELSFDYRRNSMELDQAGPAGPPNPQTARIGSHSAPIYAENFDMAQKIREMLTTQKLNTHVLPTKDSRTTTSTIDIDKRNKFTNKHFLPLPLPRTEAPLAPQIDFDTRKIKRQAFSGPITNKSSSSEPPQLANLELPSRASGPLTPTILSSPKISELHELPKPPDSFDFRPIRYTGPIGHSAPLGNKNREASPTNRNRLFSPKEGSPLPLPRLGVSQSFSVRSQIVRNIEEVTSPPLTPISLLNMRS